MPLKNKYLVSVFNQIQVSFVFANLCIFRCFTQHPNISWDQGCSCFTFTGKMYFKSNQESVICFLLLILRILNFDDNILIYMLSSVSESQWTSGHTVQLQQEHWLTVNYRYYTNRRIIKKQLVFLPVGADIQMTTTSDDVTSITQNDVYLFFALRGLTSGSCCCCCVLFLLELLLSVLIELLLLEESCFTLLLHLATLVFF